MRMFNGSHFTRRLIGSSLALAGIGIASSSWAQDATTPAVEDTTLEEIVVTAEKREENLQKTALSASVLSGVELAEQNKTSLGEILNHVPGVQMQETVGGYQINIRGVTNNAGASADNVTSVYFDNVYSSQLPIENRAAFFDVNRVEVLRGPQGTLWGGNALGGAVSIISNDPQLDRYAVNANVAAGNYDLLSSQAVINVPLSDTTAFRAVLASEKRRGYYANGQDDSDYSAARFKFLFQPSDDFKLVLTALQTKIGGEGIGTITSPYPATLTSQNDPWSNPQPVTVGGVEISPTSPAKANSYRANLEWNVGIGTLTFLPAYTTIDQNTVTSLAGGLAKVHVEHTRTNGELRLGSPSDSPIKWAIGTYYQHFNTPLHVNLTGAGVQTGQDYLRNTQVAGFGQATFPVTSAFRLTAGARYTHAKAEEGDFFSNALVTLRNTGEATFDATTWKAGFEVDVADSSMLYGNVSTGFRAGGLIAGGNNPPAVVPPGSSLPVFDPEKLTAYALGSKNEFLNRSAQLNAEVFYYDYQNYQVQSGNPLSGQTTVVNAQGVKSYGAELESIWRATYADTINASLTYLHSTFGTQTGGAGSTADPTASAYIADGADVDRSPRFTGTLGYEHKWTFGGGSAFSLGADTNYVTKQKVNFSSNCHPDGTECLSPSHHVTNAQLVFDSADSRWNATAYVRNIENYPVITGVTKADENSGVEVYNVGAPRTFGVSISLKLDLQK